MLVADMSQAIYTVMLPCRYFDSLLIMLNVQHGMYIGLPTYDAITLFNTYVNRQGITPR